ncbi:hypothetical protein DSO57_1034292 [Entomophthora muscae]|nr:hypothetical protein DSO57_1034292 [Entomophthora muscae]
MTWFDFGGDTVIDTYSHIRLTPDASSRNGYIWSKKVLPKNNWQVEFEFKVDGVSSYISGDGFAFWAATEKNKIGPVFGSSDYFNGLGVFFDTYNNGGHSESFPYVSGMKGDGKTPYNNDNDGFLTKMGGCSMDFKHRSFPTKASVTYVRGEYVHVKILAKEDNAWEDCFVATNITLPDNVYLGFTAHTGQLHDYHDIVSVTTRTSNKPPKLDAKITPNANRSHGSSWGVLGFLFKASVFVAIVVACYKGYVAHQSKANKRF